MELRTEEIGFKIAAALLLHNGEISVSDIKAIPFVTNPDQAKYTVEYLMKTFDARKFSKLVARQPMLEWDEVISLRNSQEE
jgi:hypothetical protein